MRVRDVRVADLALLATHLRDDDRRELAAARGEGTPVAGLIVRAVHQSSHCWTAANDDDDAIAVFGVAPISMLGGLGSPWLLATDEAFRHPRALVTEGRRYLAIMRTLYPRMVNHVDARNLRSIRWLKRLGFTVHPATPYGLAGEPFHKFEIGAE